MECISYSLRSGYRKEAVPEELQKFLKRMTRTQLQTSALALQSVVRQNRIYEGKNPTDELSEDDFLQAVENLFLV